MRGGGRPRAHGVTVGPKVSMTRRAREPSMFAAQSREASRHGRSRTSRRRRRSRPSSSSSPPWSSRHRRAKPSVRRSTRHRHRRQPLSANAPRATAITPATADHEEPLGPAPRWSRVGGGGPASSVSLAPDVARDGRRSDRARHARRRRAQPRPVLRMRHRPQPRPRAARPPPGQQPDPRRSRRPGGPRRSQLGSTSAARRPGSRA